MYHAHFGLERGLFDEGIAADAAVFRNSKHDRLIAHFKLALASASSSVVLHGPAGVGKTTLTSAALRASSTRLALAWLNGMPTNAAELLELDPHRARRQHAAHDAHRAAAALASIPSRDARHRFAPLHRRGAHRGSVARRAPRARPADGARMPSAIPARTSSCSATRASTSISRRPLLDSLRQRIRLRAELEPFTEAELQDYLRHQIARAGGHYDQIFAPGTVAALHRYSQGVARLANTLCESALDIAAVQHQKQLTAELVARTAVSLLGLAEPAPAARPRCPGRRPPPSRTPSRRAQRRERSPPRRRPSSSSGDREPRAIALPASPPPHRRAAGAAAPRHRRPAAARRRHRRPRRAVRRRPRRHRRLEFDGGATDVADVGRRGLPGPDRRGRAAVACAIRRQRDATSPTCAGARLADPHRRGRGRSRPPRPPPPRRRSSLPRNP